MAGPQRLQGHGRIPRVWPSEKWTGHGAAFGKIRLCRATSWKRRSGALFQMLSQTSTSAATAATLSWSKPDTAEATSPSKASDRRLLRIADAAVEDPRHGWHTEHHTRRSLLPGEALKRLSACRRELEILAMLHEHRHVNVVSGDGCLVTLCVPIATQGSTESHASPAFHQNQTALTIALSCTPWATKGDLCAAPATSGRP